MVLFVGLGNKGPSYKDTRHNLGFKVIEFLSKKAKIKLKKESNGDIGYGKIGDTDIALAKPRCFMNECGAYVFSIYKRLNPDEMIVIHDDMDLPPGRIKIKTKGGSGGHKGVEDIISVFGTKNFSRIKIGIGKPHNVNGRSYVLSKFDKYSKKIIEDACNRATDASIMIVEKGIEKAMEVYNRND